MLTQQRHVACASLSISRLLKLCAPRAFSRFISLPGCRYTLFTRKVASRAEPRCDYGTLNELARIGTASSAALRKKAQCRTRLVAPVHVRSRSFNLRRWACTPLDARGLLIHLSSRGPLMRNLPRGVPQPKQAHILALTFALQSADDARLSCPLALRRTVGSRKSPDRQWA